MAQSHKWRIGSWDHPTISTKVDTGQTQQLFSSSITKRNLILVILFAASFYLDVSNALPRSYTQPQACWDNLRNADANNDGYIDQQEYVQFATNESPDGILGHVTDYSELPLEYTLAFLTSSCFCNNPEYGGNGDNTCCIDDPRIRLPTAPDDSPSDLDAKYLSAVCSLTEAAAETILLRPSSVPSNAPTSTPTDTPSLQPTLELSGTPTSSPTTTPPTTLPTSSPTAPPTTLPTSSPTTPPTTLPTSSPTSQGTSLSPTWTPTAEVPTVAPSSPPTVTALIEGNATVTYNISIKNGSSLLNSETFKNDYLSNMIVGLDRVADDVARDADRRSLRYRIHSRKLLETNRIMQKASFSLKLPAIIQSINKIECPSGTLIPAGGAGQGEEIVLNEDDICQEVTAAVTLGFDSTLRNIESFTSQFGSDMYNSIYDGHLQAELDSIYQNLNSPPGIIVVLTGYVRSNEPTPIMMTPNAAPIGPNGTLSPGAKTGITLGVIAAAIAPIALYLSSRTRSDEEKKPEDYKEYQPDNGDLDDMDTYSPRAFVLPDGSVAGSQHTDFAVKSTGSLGAAGATTLGAAQTDYGKAGHSSKKVIETMMLDDGEDIVAEQGMPENDSSSNAGSSGWSSSAGISSLNTGSIDDSADIAAAAGATLAGISLASATFRQQQQRAAATSKSSIDTDDDSLSEERKGSTKSMESSSSPSNAVTRDQLDSLIESGDWAAVGATAALLAAASDSQSATTGQSRASKSISVGSQGSRGSVDAARAAELDHLVDAGDWEGVVLAAAKFEATAEVQSASLSRDSRSHNNSSQESTSDAQDSGTGTGTYTGTFDPSLSTSRSDDPIRAAKLAEYRSEVEALVRRVVPEEIDNVDEMMNQFKGREEELVETLRTMQERAVAQKARQAGQKNAKIEARRTVQRGVVPGVDAAAQRVVNEERNDVVASAAPEVATGSVAKTTESNREPLVGITIGRTEAETSPSTMTPQLDSMTDKRKSLEAAIEANDWRAVGEVAAAISSASASAATSITSGEIDRLANMDTTSSEGTEGSRKRQLQGTNAERAAELDAMIDTGDWNAVVSVANRFAQEDKKQTNPFIAGKISKEEEDALREAELWMKIAEQKKAEGAHDIGASDAAEWAIQRSLSQLRDAEKKQKMENKDKFHGEEV